MFVFLDYDGTLIKTKEEIFQENYFKKFLKHTGIKDNNIIRIILECTSELVKSTEEKENNLAFLWKNFLKKQETLLSTGIIFLWNFTNLNFHL